MGENPQINYSKDYLSPLLSTKTDRVDWGTDFLESFNVNMDAIYINDDIDINIIFNKPTVDNWDEEEEMYYITEFSIQQTDSKKSIKYESPAKLFINPKLLTVERMKNDEDAIISINSKSLQDDDFIFKYQAKNNELTKSLQQILDLIESSEHLGITDYNDFVNKFDDLLIENDMDFINSVHIEMISSVLIQNPETNKRLDFSKDILDPYKIIRVSKSILNGPLATSLSFERLNDQLVDLATYEKDDVSMMDYLFM